MGQEQGKPVIDRESAAYKEAEKRFNVVTRPEDVVRATCPEEAEAMRLAALLGGLEVMDPLLKSSLQTHILSSRREAGAQELAGTATTTAAGAQQGNGPMGSPIPATPITAAPPARLPSASTPQAATAASSSSTAAPTAQQPQHGLYGKGLNEQPLIQLLARSQTAEHRCTTEMAALQEDMLGRMSNIKYNSQFLKYKASQVTAEVQQFSRSVAAEENAIKQQLGEMEALSADIVGLIGMIELLGEELGETTEEASR